MGTNFWDRNAGRYDRFMEKDRGAYEQMYGLIRPVVRHKTVLELATGTGLIAKHILREADRIEATDASPGNDRRGAAGELLRQAPFLRGGPVLPALRGGLL